MNQFVVPQFIDVEDKIFGPITTRQFLILFVAGLIMFIVFKLADTALFIFLFLIIVGFALVLAFVKINGQFFHYFLLNICQSMLRPSIRIWFKLYSDVELNAFRKQEKAVVTEKKVMVAPTHTRIRDLSLMVNTGGYYKGTR